MAARDVKFVLRMQREITGQENQKRRESKELSAKSCYLREVDGERGHGGRHGEPAPPSPPASSSSPLPPEPGLSASCHLHLHAMNSTLFIIGVIGNVISVLVFISPIPTFWRIVRSKSTEDFEAAPYVLTLLNTLLWLYYGLTKPDGLLVATVNGFGAVMETIYLVLFLVYAADKDKMVKTVKLVAALDIGFFGVVFTATTFAIGELDMKIMVIGLICACLSVFMYGSPLAAVRRVISSKSVEYMPFFLSFFLFLNGGVWAAYAILDKDVFLGVPNGIGCFLGGIQLVIYAVYMKSKVASHSNGSDEAAYDASASLLSSEASKHSQHDAFARV